MNGEQLSFPGIPRLADKVPPLTQYGDYVRVADILEESVLVVKIDDWKGKGDSTMASGDSLLVAADMEDEAKIWFIVGHEVLYRKLSMVRDDLPVVATFFQPEGKRYYDVR
jgi:hypothetical protein